MFLLKKILNKAKKLKIILRRYFKKKITFNGSSFKLRTNTWITKYRFDSFDNKEPETLEWIDKNLMENDVFFDVGANVGIYSLYTASKNIANCKIYSFEPEYSNLNELKFNVLSNKFEKKIKIYSFAFGEFNHISSLNIADTTPGAALHFLENRNSNIESKIEEGVYVLKMDEFCNNQHIFPNLIKIDIDGNELKLLKGAKNVLKNKKLRTIIIEIDNIKIKDECINLIQSNGFELISFFKNNSAYIFYRYNQ